MTSHIGQLLGMPPAHDMRQMLVPPPFVERLHSDATTSITSTVACFKESKPEGAEIPENNES